MTIALLCSQADVASVNIRDRLEEMLSWTITDDLLDGLPILESDGLLLFETPEIHIECEHIDKRLREATDTDFDAVLVLSKHRAESGQPALTVHPIGNYNEADFGGAPRTLTPAPAALMGRVLRGLWDAATDAGLHHQVTYEATHHGPHMETPTAFVEIGTDDAAWRDPALGRAVARAIVAASGGPVTVDEDEPVLVGVGGSHYVPKMTDLARKRKCAFGHLIPGYQIDAGIEPDVVRQAAERTPGATGYVFDDRGFHGDARPILDALEDAGLTRVRGRALDTRK